MLEDKKIKVGNKCQYKNGYTGTIRFVGKISKSDKNQQWIVGIEWDEKGVGKTDGSLNGERIFTTSPNTATFVELIYFEMFFKILN